MPEEFLKFCTPEINQEIIDEVIACLKSGWLATGPRVERFEADLKKYLGAPYVLALTSGTAALHLALKCFGLKAGDEVITTPMTFVASLNTIVHVGAKPVLVDVDLKTRNIDVTKLEDSAHAMGSLYKGKVIGSFGDTQGFSFHPNKVMTTGEGGCISTRDEKLAQEVKVQRFHGIDRESFDRYGKKGKQDYDVIQPGYKYNMLDLEAAIGIHQLAQLESFIAKRQSLVDRYNEKLANWPELTLPELPNFDCRVSWYIYAPLINPDVAKMNRDTFIERMKEQDIGTGYHHHAAHLYTYYQKTYGYERGQFPNAETISDRIVSLPLFTTMTLADQDRVIAAMKKILNSRRSKL